MLFCDVLRPEQGHRSSLAEQEKVDPRYFELDCAICLAASLFLRLLDVPQLPILRTTRSVRRQFVGIRFRVVLIAVI